MVFNLLSSYNPAGRSHCRLQNHHEYIKHHHRGMGGLYRFTYVTAHSATLLSLYRRHSSFYSSSVASPKSQLFLQPFRHFTYVTAYSPTLPSLCLRHSSFSNPSVALPTSQLILQSFRCFTYVTVHSPILLSLLLRHELYT